MLLSLPHVRHGWYLVADAHVRAVIVVEMDKASDDHLGMFSG